MAPSAPGRRISERDACRLKQRGGCEGRWRGLRRRLGCRGGHCKESAFRGFFRQRGVEDVFFAFFEERGRVPLGAPLPAIEDRFGAEVLCLFECLDLALPINDEAESNTLNAPGTEARYTRLVRECGRHLVANKPISAAPRFLRVDKVIIELPRRFDSSTDDFFCNGIEGDTCVPAKVKNLLQVPCNGFALAVGVRCEINLLRASGSLSQLRNDGFAIDTKHLRHIQFNFGAELAPLVACGDQLDVTPVVATLHFEGGHFNLLYQLPLIGVHCVQPVEHVVLVDMGGGVAQCAKRIHLPERTLALPLKAAVHTLRLVHNQDRPRGANEVNGLLASRFFRVLVEVVYVLFVDGADGHHHNLDLRASGKVAHLAELA